MLAASPSQSPSAFPQNGSMQSSYQSSPRFSAAAPQRSPKLSAENALNHQVPGQPQRSNYQNATTQYSPMSEASQKSPKAPAPQKRESSLGQNVPQDEMVTVVAPTTTVPDVTTWSTELQAPARRNEPQSPGTKRRPFKSINEISSSAAIRQSNTSKRPKSTKIASKILPVRYEFCEVEDIVILIADMISELIETNDNLPFKDGALTRFHSRTPPGISVIDYLQRLAKHAALTPPLLLSMVYYIDRLCSLYPAFTINTLTVHRFLITAATVAAKGLSDSFWNNSTYARVGGIKLAELGLLELEFLYRVDWRIVPNPEVLEDYYRGLIARTDDYILEGHVDTEDDKQDDKDEPGKEELMTGNDSLTNNKWNKWMQDVADSSQIKNDPPDAPA